MPRTAPTLPRAVDSSSAAPPSREFKAQKYHFASVKTSLSWGVEVEDYRNYGNFREMLINVCGLIQPDDFFSPSSRVL